MGKRYMTADEFSAKLYAYFKATADKSGQPLKAANWLATAANFFREHIEPKMIARKRRSTKAPARARNLFFDALAVGCGYNLNRIGRVAGSTIGAAVSDIREANPDATPEEIQTRARAIMKRYEKAGPMAVAAHYADREFGGGNPTKRALSDVSIEPEGWREFALANWPDALDWVNAHDFKTIPWREVVLTLREIVVQELPKWRAKNAAQPQRDRVGAAYFGE